MASSSRITIELWDSKLAPLNLEERASVTWMRDRCDQKPLPAKFQNTAALQPNPSSRPDTPMQNNFLRKVNSRIDLASAASGPAASSSKAGSARGRSSSAVGPSGTAALPSGGLTSLDAPIETTQQFSDWFGRVEQEIEAEHERDYRLHLNTVDAYLDGCDEILDTLEESRGLLYEMEANYKFVEENSRALQAACEDMLGEQKHLLEVTDAIGSRLDYFKELDRATRTLNLPGDTLVLEPDFLNLVDRLDMCLDFLRANRNFKDAEVYIIRFQQCLTRSMTLIKMFFISQLNLLAVEVSEKSNKSLNDMAVQALLYSKFVSVAQPMRPLLYELEKRAVSDPDEYGALLSDCHAAWFAVRNALLSERVTQEVQSMEPYTADIIKLARSGCNYLRSVCLSEWDLFKQYFSSTGQDEIYAYLESLCDKLYDYLRPRILHEPRLEMLCELCTILQALMALDPSGKGGAADDEEGEEDGDTMSFISPLTPPASQSGAGGSFFPAVSTSTPTKSRPFGSAQDQHLELAQQQRMLGHLKFSKLLQGLLQDAQTRLVFRAQAIIQNDVLHYSPTDEDLDYPSKLKGNRRMSLWYAPEGQDGSNEDIEGPSLRLPDVEIQESWYPTLRKTLWVLSRLHTYVKDAIFEDLAGEAVTVCRQSLVTASQRMAAMPGSSTLDAQLFSIRHLLILKEMIRTIDLVHVERGPDFYSVSDALSGLLWSSSALLNPSNLFEMASKSMQGFGETMKDAKIELDVALKTICEELIVQAGLSIASPLRAFVSRAQAYLATPIAGPNPPVLDLTAQPWATGDEVHKIHDVFVNEGLQQATRDILGKLETWLTDSKALSVLVPPIQEEVSQTYKQFYNLVRSEYDFAVSNTLQPPSALRDKLQQLGGAASASVIGKKG